MRAMPLKFSIIPWKETANLTFSKTMCPGSLDCRLYCLFNTFKIFPESACEGFSVKKQPFYYISISSDLQHLHLTSAILHPHTSADLHHLTSADLHHLTSAALHHHTSADLHHLQIYSIYIISHLQIYIITHLQI